MSPQDIFVGNYDTTVQNELWLNTRTGTKSGPSAAAIKFIIKFCRSSPTFCTALLHKLSIVPRALCARGIHSCVWSTVSLCPPRTHLRQALHLPSCSFARRAWLPPHARACAIKQQTAQTSSDDEILANAAHCTNDTRQWHDSNQDCFHFTCILFIKYEDMIYGQPQPLRCLAPRPQAAAHARSPRRTGPIAVCASGNACGGFVCGEGGGSRYFEPVPR